MTTDTKPRRTVTYAGLMAYRKQEYHKHFTPSVKTLDAQEASMQEYLNTTYAGDDVFVLLHQDGKKDHTRLWEWNANEFKHGPSCVAWLREKLKVSFSYPEERIEDYISKVVHIDVRQTNASAGDDPSAYRYDLGGATTESD